jgi:hypothetical protein
MTIRTIRRATICLAACALPACSGNGLGALGDILGGVGGQPASGGQTGQVSAEIRQIDAQQQRIQIATTDGQMGFIRYDQNTVVVYQQQQYPVTALERGDLAVITVQQDAQSNYYAQRIEVTQSVQERTGQTGGAVQQFTGRVGQIDHSRGWFVLQAQSGNLTVSLPFNPPQATLDYFNRLRTGDSVRVEATIVGTGRAEIHRFL